MATQNISIGTDRIDVQTPLGLASGTDYHFQNGGTADIYIAESVAEPTVVGHLLRFGQSLVVTVPAAGVVWAWVPRERGTLVVTEAS